MILLSDVSKISARNKNILYFIFAFYLIYFCSSTIISQALIGSNVSLIISALFDLTLLIFVGISLIREQFMPLIIMVGCILLTIIINFDYKNLTGYMIVILRILNATLILSAVDYKCFFKAVSLVIALISFVSVLINQLWTIVPFQSFLPRIVNRSGIGFYYAGFAFKIDSYGYFSARNYGIFSEPAVFCFFLFIGAYFEMNSERKGWLKDAIIITDCIALVSTLSPIGYIAAAAIIILRIFQPKAGRGRIIIYPFAIILFAVFIITSELSDTLLKGIDKMTISSGNGLGRAEAISKNIEYWMKNPIFGVGLSGNESIVSSLGFNTSTIGSMLSMFGFLFSVTVLIISFLSIYKTSVQRSVIAQIIWFVVFILMVNNHGLIQSEWFWIFALLGLFGGEEHKKALDSGSKFAVFKL